MTPFSFEVLALQPVRALLRRAPGARDQPAELAVAATVGGEQHAAQAVHETELAADQDAQAVLFRRDVCTHDARDGAFVGDRERFVAERGGTLDEFLRV